MINKKAIIFCIKGHKLNNKQKLFLKKTKPWGIILFSRNIKNLNQLTKLVNEIKKIELSRKIESLEDKVSINLDESLYSELLSLRNQLKGG